MRDCVDCGTCVVGDTGLVENYIVHDELWAEAGMEACGGFLCVNCLEGRLGRRLTGADFPTDLPINMPGQQRDTHRLYRLKLWAVVRALGKGVDA